MSGQGVQLNKRQAKALRVGGEKATKKKRVEGQRVSAAR